MQIYKAVNKLSSQRIKFILTGSLLLSVILLLLFYSLFLIIPSVFVQAGLISRVSLLIIFFLSFTVSITVYIYRSPFSGNRFLNEIVVPPYSYKDVKVALELEGGRSFPRKETVDPAGPESATFLLSDSFTQKVLRHIKPAKGISGDILPDIKRIAVIAIILILAIVLSFFKYALVIDMFTALRMGVPAELVALDSPLKFEKIEATVTPPAYLESIPSYITDLNVKNKVKVIQGSGIRIKGTLKSIRSGRLILSTMRGIEYFQAALSGNSLFEVAFLAPMKGAFALEFDLEDGKQRVTSGKSRIFIIDAMPDQPPAIKIFSPPADYGTNFGSPIEISFAASDDYGILEISLYHRNPDEGKEYYKELVARFPRGSKTSYTYNYIWNPVIREGDKIDELVYSPETKTVEYFLEVKDINVFSSAGTGRSGIRHVHFRDTFADFKKGINLIRELIEDGKKLMTSPDNNIMKNDYKKKLGEAVQVFSKEWGEAMPQSNLIQRTGEMVSILYFDDIPQIKKSLNSYIEYLERLLVFMNLLKDLETGKSIDKEISGTAGSGNNSNNIENSLKRIGTMADNLEKEFKKDIEEIRDLMNKGDHSKARMKMSELLEKVRKRMSEEIAKSMAVSQRISDEIKAALEKMISQAESLLKNQIVNKARTDKGMIKGPVKKQEDINDGLWDLKIQSEKLSAGYPFIMYSLNSYISAAHQSGGRALENLKKPDPVKASAHQAGVIQHLKSFLQSASQQKKLTEEMAAGNFEQVMSRGFRNQFVLIPKEAVYTIPIDYKSKVIEQSRDRTKSSKKKEAFWRDILE